MTIALIIYAVVGLIVFGLMLHSFLTGDDWNAPNLADIIFVPLMWPLVVIYGVGAILYFVIMTDGSIDWKGRL